MYMSMCVCLYVCVYISVCVCVFLGTELRAFHVNTPQQSPDDCSRKSSHSILRKFPSSICKQAVAFLKVVEKVCGVCVCVCVCFCMCVWCFCMCVCVCAFACVCVL